MLRKNCFREKLLEADLVSLWGCFEKSPALHVAERTRALTRAAMVIGLGGAQLTLYILLTSKYHIFLPVLQKSLFPLTAIQATLSPPLEKRGREGGALWNGTDLFPPFYSQSSSVLS
jgi:hypothetical protein